MQIGRVALVVVVSAVYFGLAVLGWGGLAPSFSHPARIALALVVCAMVGVALFAGGNVSAGVREDRRNRWVLAVFAVLGLLDGWLPAYTDRIGFWTIDGNVLRWAGLALFAAGGALHLWPVFVLGNRFSGLVAIQPGHTLVTDGVYGIMWPWDWDYWPSSRSVASVFGSLSCIIYSPSALFVRGHSDGLASEISPFDELDARHRAASRKSVPNSSSGSWVPGPKVVGTVLRCRCKWSNAPRAWCNASPRPTSP